MFLLFVIGEGEASGNHIEIASLTTRNGIVGADGYDIDNRIINFR